MSNVVKSDIEIKLSNLYYTANIDNVFKPTREGMDSQETASWMVYQHLPLYYLSIGCECPDEEAVEVVVVVAVITLGCQWWCGGARLVVARCPVVAWSQCTLVLVQAGAGVACAQLGSVACRVNTLGTARYQPVRETGLVKNILSLILQTYSSS